MEQNHEEINPTAHYDSISYGFTINLLSLNRERGSINLYGFNYKNPEHLYAFERAINVSSLIDKPIKIDCPFFTRLRLSIKYLPQVGFIKRAEKITDEDKIVDEILEFMRPYAKKITKDPEFSFTKISEYYKRGI